MAVVENWQVILNHIAHQAMYDSDGAQKEELFHIAEQLRRVIQLSYIDHGKMRSSSVESGIDQAFGLLYGVIDKHFRSKPVERAIVRKATGELRDVLRRTGS